MGRLRGGARGSVGVAVCEAGGGFAGGFLLPRRWRGVGLLVGKDAGEHRDGGGLGEGAGEMGPAAGG